MTKLIVYPNIEFEIDDKANKDECTAFLLSKGFQDIGNFHFGISSIKCTAKFYGKPKPDFKMILQDCSQYGEWIKHRGLGHAQLVELNAQELNELCARNGHER